MKKYLNRLFIDGLSGMAYGLFSTLIIGTIICQVGSLIGDNTIGKYITVIGSVAKTITGAGIGVGVACKLKASPLTTVSAAVAGTVGAFPSLVIEGFSCIPGRRHKTVRNVPRYFRGKLRKLRYPGNPDSQGQYP